MFEQSLLIDHAGTRKTATFAASLTAQMLAAGVLLVVPLLYHDVLPALHVPEIVRVVTPWRPPDAPATQPQPPSRSTGLATPGPFRAPVLRHTDYPDVGLIVLDTNAPALSTNLAIPLPSALPSLEGPKTAGPITTEIFKTPDAPVRIGGDILSAKLLRQVVPVYPRAAVQIRISGTVHLLGIIAKDGTIQRLQVLSGHPLLRQAALDAVSQWIYRPTILNGQAVEVEAPIDVIFTLAR